MTDMQASNSSGDHKAAGPAAVTQAEGRAALLGLLAALYRHAPNEETLLTLRRAGFREALDHAGMQLEAAFFSMNIKQLAEQLAVEFADLFLIPGRLISPHESVQTKGGSGLLRGPETAQVRRYYEGVGFQLDDTTAMEPDHISIELEFLSHLAAEEAVAWKAGEPSKAIDALHFQNDFLQQHLGRWVFGFVQRVAGAAKGGFYGEISNLTGAVLSDQSERLAQVIRDLPATNASTMRSIDGE